LGVVPTDEDDLGFVPPTKPSELRALSDVGLATAYRKLAFGSRYQFDRMFEMEAQFRLIEALAAEKKAADRSAKILNVLTLVLVALTIVLVVIAIRGG
jgi:hypothetical protein